jgi:hypothetical protein
MVMSRTEHQDFAFAAFRAREESRRIRAQRAPEPAPVYYESDEEARIAHERTTKIYLEDIMGYDSETIERIKTQIASCYRKLDPRL